MMRGEVKPMIKKCYPHGREAENSPRSNELSTLIFHLESQHSKIPKASRLLLERTEKYSNKGNLGNLTVTVRIMRGIVSSKCNQHLDLFASDVLDIIGISLRSPDESLAEEAAGIFEEFNDHHTGVLFAGHAEYTQKFLAIVDAFNQLCLAKTSRQVRLASLDALRSLTTSPALATRIGQQALQSTVPVFYALIPPETEIFVRFTDKWAEHERDVRAPGPNPARTSDFTNQAPPANGIAGQVTPGSDKNGSSNTSKIKASEAYKALDGLRSCLDMNSGDQLARVFTTILRTMASDKVEKPKNWRHSLIISAAKWCEIQLRFAVLKTLVAEMTRMSPSKDIATEVLFSDLLYALLQSDVSKVGLSVVDMLRQLLELQHRTLLSDSGVGSTEHGRQFVQNLRLNIAALAQLKVYPGLVTDMITEVLMKYASADAQTSGSSTPTGSSSSHQPRPSSIVLNDLQDIREILSAVPSHQKLPSTLWISTQWMLTSQDTQLLSLYSTVFIEYLQRSHPASSPMSRSGSVLPRQLCQSLLERTNQSANYIAIYYCLVAIVDNLKGPSASSVIPWILETQKKGHVLTTTDNKSEFFQGTAIISVSQALLLAIARATDRERVADTMFDVIGSRVEAQQWLPGIIYPVNVAVAQGIETAVASETPVFAQTPKLETVSTSQLDLTDSEREWVNHQSISLDDPVLPEDLNVLKMRARSVSESTNGASSRRLASDRSLASMDTNAPRVIDLVRRRPTGSLDSQQHTLRKHESVLDIVEQLRLDGPRRGRLTTT